MHGPARLLLLTAASIVALALTTSSASAWDIEFLDEATGNECSVVAPFDSTEFPIDPSVTGGCAAHFVNTEGLVVLTAHIFGIESTDAQCTSEFTARIGGNAEGYLTNIELAGCGRIACRSVNGFKEAWGVHGDEGIGTSARLEVHMCLQNLDGSGRQTCHTFLPFSETQSGSHRYELGTVNAAEIRGEIMCEGFTGFQAEVSGHWKTEAGSLEMVHDF